MDPTTLEVSLIIRLLFWEWVQSTPQKVKEELILKILKMWQL